MCFKHVKHLNALKLHLKLFNFLKTREDQLLGHNQRKSPETYVTIMSVLPWHCHFGGKCLDNIDNQ
jgi:hypothetical protein